MSAAVLRLLLLTLAATAAFATTASATARTVVFNLYPPPLERPDRVFFQADAGPYLDELDWTGWGSPEAVGRGTYVLACTGCGAREDIQRFPAVYTLSRRASCPRFGPSARTYLKGVVRIELPEGAKTKRFDSDADFCAKRPSRAASVRAVERFLRARGPARRISVSCRVDDAISWSCRARYTVRGKRRTREVSVFGRRNASPGAVSYG